MITRNYSTYDEDSSNDSNSYLNSKYISIDFENLFQEKTNILKYNNELENKLFTNTNENFKSTFNQVFILRKEETEIENENKKYLFSTKHFTNKRKRGRLTSNKKKRNEHTKYTEDNVITKIQTHYMNFIINLNFF